MRAAVFVLAITSVFAADNRAFDRASALYNRTDYRGAISVVKQAPQDVRSLELMGRAYFMDADFKRATETLEKAASLDPNSSAVQLWLGRAYGRRAETSFALAALGDATKARKAFERAVELDPSNLDAVNDLFEFYLQAPGIVGGG